MERINNSLDVRLAITTWNIQRDLETLLIPEIITMFSDDATDVVRIIRNLKSITDNLVPRDLRSFSYRPQKSICNN